MKIAICFSGLVRTFEQCWPSYEYLLKRYDCDCFAVSTPGNVLHKYPFTKILYQKDEVMPDKWYNFNFNPKSPGQSMLLQFYAIELCNDLRRQYEKDKGVKYDFIVRTRTDAQLLGELPAFEDCDPSKIYVPEGHDHPEAIPGFGLSDRFAFGGDHVMNVYSNKIGVIDDYMSTPDPWYFAEVILNWTLRKNNIQIERFPDLVKILRHDGNLV